VDALKSVEQELRREISQRKQETRALGDELDKSARRCQLSSQELNGVNQQIAAIKVAS